MSSHTPLLFIDTNIFLDFYRATGSADFKLLGRLKTILASIITSGQIEMEFQKNRQKLMHTSFQKLVLQGRPEVPGLFVHSKEGDMLTGALRQVDESLKELKKSLSAAMKDPALNDPVYRAANDIFSFESDFNLNRTKLQRYRIRRLARRRFMLGYPPRKDRDTSIGDAVNWEWIIECAKKSGRSVIVVSRDGDYGLQFAGESHLNEWLRREFSERVGRKSHITLTESLSGALKQIKVHVTKAEEEAEKKLIEKATWKPSLRAVDISSALDRIVAEQRRDPEGTRRLVEAVLGKPVRRVERLAESQRQLSEDLEDIVTSADQ